MVNAQLYGLTSQAQLVLEHRGATQQRQKLGLLRKPGQRSYPLLGMLVPENYELSPLHCKIEKTGREAAIREIEVIIQYIQK